MIYCLQKSREAGAAIAGFGRVAAWVGGVLPRGVIGEPMSQL